VTKPIDLRANKTGGREKPQSADSKGDLSEVVLVKGKKNSTRTGATARSRNAPKPEIIDQIRSRLRGAYNDVLMQPIPDRFLDLLQQLEAGKPAEAQQPARKTASKKEAT
jgi:Anti-sigma factor NepR